MQITFDNKNNKNDLTYIRMLEYLGEYELAKSENLRVLEDWREYIKNTDLKLVSDKNLALNSFNSRVKIINERFSTNINPIVENILPFQINPQNPNAVHGSIIKLSHIFSIINPSSKIIKLHQIGDYFFQIRENGSIIKHDKDGVILNNFQTNPCERNSSNYINISNNSTTLFYRNIVVKENSFITLRYNTEIKENGLIQPIPYSQVYIPKEIRMPFSLQITKKHEMHFFSNDGTPINKIYFGERPIEIIPDIEIVLCVKEDKSCEVYTLEGVHKYSMPSNNAVYSFKNYYDFSLNSDLFIGWDEYKISII
ncbi:MAG: hypothetical protein IPJ13_02230 [Saprospiraceae bacterium]|nr:hypothetical protein [Saprospiraceae bacterium]